jgi:SET domain-containing protein
MSKRPFRVGRSRTGLGLFATKPIPKRTVIVEYRGRWLRAKEADALEAKGSRYMYEINSRWTIDGSNRRNVGRYANHSCRPNAESDIVKCPIKGKKVIIRTIKAIEPGDEITYDYGRDYFNAYIKPIGCKCDKCIEKRRTERAAKRRNALIARKRAATRLKNQRALKRRS